jgi:hypothetical protein
VADDGFTCEIVGFDAFDRALSAVLPRIVQAGIDALPAEANAHILDPALELVPRDTEDLARSGYVSDPIEIGDQVALVVGFTDSPGHEPGYALDQHQNPNYTHAEGKSDKFLEKPVLEWTKQGPGRVARKMAKAL